jgi:hypothetical protein
MAKAKQKGIPVIVQGMLWGRDVTVGREPALSVSVQPLREYTQVSVVTTKTKKVTPAQKAQRDTYCDCDKQWKSIPNQKKNKFDAWYRAIRGKPYDSVRAYTVYMTFCLKNRPELPAFLYNQYVTYFTVRNTESTGWTNRCVILFGFPYARADGTDIAVYKISGIGWMEGRKKFESYMISETLIPTIPSPGKARLSISDLAPGQSITIAVYSYRA